MSQFVKSSILENVFINARKKFQPLVVTFEITQVCNFKCHHCYNFDRTLQVSESVKFNELSKKEVLKVIDELAEAGTLYLNFTGGEVLTHPHLNEFISRARFYHFEVRLKTNASLLTTEICKTLDRDGLAGFDISLYGFSEYSYNKLTHKVGMFDKIMMGIQNAKTFGFDICINIIIHKYNLAELKQMIDFCNSLSLDYNFSIEITERYDGSVGAKNIEITNEQFIEQLKGDHKDIFMYINDGSSVQCSCAKTVCGITSTGIVYPCISAPIACGNLRESSFSEVWENSVELNKIRGYKNSDFVQCMSCDYIKTCNRSSGSIFVNTKNYTGCDESTFRQAKVRHELGNAQEIT